MGNDYPFINVGDHYINYRHIIEIEFRRENIAVITITTGEIFVTGEKNVDRLKKACERWTALHLDADLS